MSYGFNNDKSKIEIPRTKIKNIRLTPTNNETWGSFVSRIWAALQSIDYYKVYKLIYHHASGAETEFDTPNYEDGGMLPSSVMLGRFRYMLGSTPKISTYLFQIASSSSLVFTTGATRIINLKYGEPWEVIELAGRNDITSNNEYFTIYYIDTET